MNSKIPFFETQDFYSETKILELIKEQEQIEKRLLNKISLLKKLKKSKKNKADIKNTRAMLKNARAEIKGYQIQTLNALTRVKEEYKHLMKETNAQAENKPTPFLLSDFKEGGDYGIDFFIEELEASKSTLQYDQMALLGFTFLPIIKSYDLHQIAANLSEAQTYVEDSEAYSELHDNSIIQVLRAIQKGFLATMILSTGDKKTKANFLSYCRFGFGF